MAATRHVTPLETGFRFQKSDSPRAADPDFDDSSWSVVRVPHDWAIEGPFDRDNDVQETTILEDGEQRPAEHVGRTGGLPHVGVAWYRKRFAVDAAHVGGRERRVFVEMDGVMSHSRVYCNGALVGAWPYGYASFSFDITDHVAVGKENVLAVRVDNKADASRWYPGAGIYRYVRIVVTDPVHVPYCGTFVTSQPDPSGGATIQIRAEVVDASAGDREGEGGGEGIAVRTRILAPDGRAVADVEADSIESLRQPGGGPDRLVAITTVRLPEARLWSVDSPDLYTAATTLSVAGTVVDEHETVFGVRSTAFDPDSGFLLNGQPCRLKGVCMHHDLGALGAAVNVRALERQLEILKDMGCNAIRTSHNPPAPELLALTDSMGFLVIDEAFDEWRVAKVGNGYHTLFDEWAEKDLRAMIRRDRNHPSVILWSIGNEVRDQGIPKGAATAARLTEICHEEDPTRPVTAGFNNSEDAIRNGLAAAVDVPGWNYKPHLYARYHAEHPQWPMYGSETESCVSSRGEYNLPVAEERDLRRSTLHVTSYDVAAPPWGYSPEYEFTAGELCPFIAGEFVWTGFDYLGEPTPYKTEWPSRSAYFGIVDLAGFPKDRYYLYRSHWSDEPTLHLLPHWNWAGREGESIPVHCYTSFPEAELFLNGRSLGRRRKEGGSPPAIEATVGQMELLDRYRLRWEVAYEPGTLRVIAYDSAGDRAAETEVRTAGPPARVELSVDQTSISADGVDLVFVSATIVDEEGTVCPHSDTEVRFEASGPGRIVATDNGDQTSLVPFQSSLRTAFHGRCLAIVAADSAGEVVVTATPENTEGGVPRVAAAGAIRAVAPDL